MPNLQRPQRHNPLRPYIDHNDSNDSFAPTFPSSNGGTNTPLSSDSEGGPDGVNSSSSYSRGGTRSEANEKMEHQVYMGGGTGIQVLKEPKEIVRKRVAIMTICGLIVAAIIAIAILGVKKLL